MSYYSERVLTYIDRCEESIQLDIVYKDGFAIRGIVNPSEVVQAQAVKSAPRAIKYISRPTKQVKMIALKWDKSGTVISLINRPSEELKLFAVRHRGWVIRNIKNPSEAVQLAAVENTTSAFKFIKNPAESVRKFIEDNPEL